MLLWFGGLSAWYSPFGWIAYGPRLEVPLLGGLAVAYVHTVGESIVRIAQHSRLARVLGYAVVLAGSLQFFAPWRYTDVIGQLILGASFLSGHDRAGRLRKTGRVLPMRRAGDVAGSNRASSTTSSHSARRGCRSRGSPRSSRASFSGITSAQVTTRALATRSPRRPRRNVEATPRLAVGASTLPHREHACGGAGSLDHRADGRRPGHPVGATSGAVQSSNGPRLSSRSPPSRSCSPGRGRGSSGTGASAGTPRSSSGMPGGSGSACSALDDPVVDEPALRPGGHVPHRAPARDAAHGRSSRRSPHSAGRWSRTALLVLATLAAAGVLAWRLGLAMGLGTVGSWVAGLLWASSPIVVYRASSGLYMLLLLAALLPGTLLLALRLMHGFSIGRAVALGVLPRGMPADRPPGHGLPHARRRSSRRLCRRDEARVALARGAEPAGGRRGGVLGRWLASAGHGGAGGDGGRLRDADRQHGSRRRRRGTPISRSSLLPSPASRFFGDDYARAADSLGNLASFPIDSSVALGWATTALALIGIAGNAALAPDMVAGERRARLRRPVPRAHTQGLRPRPHAPRRRCRREGLAGRAVDLAPRGAGRQRAPDPGAVHAARRSPAGAPRRPRSAGARPAPPDRRDRGCRRALRAGRRRGSRGAARAIRPRASSLARIIRDDPRPGIVVDVPLSWRSGIDLVGSPRCSRLVPWSSRPSTASPSRRGTSPGLDRTMLDRLLARPLYRSLLLRQGDGEIPPGLEPPSAGGRDRRRRNASAPIGSSSGRRRTGGSFPYLAELGYHRRRRSDDGALLYGR